MIDVRYFPEIQATRRSHICPKCRDIIVTKESIERVGRSVVTLRKRRKRRN